jgi:predicted PurR-regulated permease PerM
MSSQGIGALGTALGQAFTGFGQFLLGSFSIGFIAFFILRNPKMLPGLFLDLPPQRYRRSFMRAMLRTRELLYRYFFGLLVKVVSLGVIAGTGFLIADVEGAVFFGLVYGALDVIPYLGPLLSTSITTLISLGYALNQPEPMIGWLLLKIGAVFAVAQLSDNFLLEPFIYSGSIRAHPLEVFFVILLAGHIGGIPGMVLGIPIYTVLRVLVQEFAAHLPVVARLMRHQGPQG